MTPSHRECDLPATDLSTGDDRSGRQTGRQVGARWTAWGGLHWGCEAKQEAGQMAVVGRCHQQEAVTLIWCPRWRRTDNRRCQSQVGGEMRALEREHLLSTYFMPENSPGP